jgi:anti-sigma factor ChrR (cupin superfamily)
VKNPRGAICAPLFLARLLLSEENWSQNGKKASRTTISSDQNGLFGL